MAGVSAVEMVSSADMVVLVARVGVTKTDHAHQCIDLLNRLDVPLAGVVLIGVAAASNDYYYYYQPGRVPAGGDRSSRSGSRAQPVTGNGNGKGQSPPEMFLPEGAAQD